MNYPETAVVIDSSPADPGAPSPSIGAYSVATLVDRGVLSQKIDLSRLPRAALLDGYPSDRLNAAAEAVRNAEFVAVAADASRPESLGLLKLFVSRVPASVWRRRPVLVILASANGPRGADLAARTFRSVLVGAGASDVDVAVLDPSADGFDIDVEALLSSRLARATSRIENELLELAGFADRAA